VMDRGILTCGIVEVTVEVTVEVMVQYSTVQYNKVQCSTIYKWSQVQSMHKIAL
jgi:hypothetical protein